MFRKARSMDGFGPFARKSKEAGVPYKPDMPASRPGRLVRNFSYYCNNTEGNNLNCSITVNLMEQIHLFYFVRGGEKKKVL